MSTVSNWRGPNIVKDGLVLYLNASSPNSYSIYFSGTTWKDISSNNNNGVLINGPTFNNTNWGSISFDGTNDYGTIPYNANFNFSNTDYTLEGWFNSNSFSLGQTLISKDTYGVNFDWALFISNSTTLIYYSNQTTTSVTATIPTLSTNQWYQYVVTSISGTIRIYINSVLYQTQVMSTSNSSQNFVTLGSTSWNNPISFMNGRISILRAYRKGLTTNEVINNYSTTLQQYYDSDAVTFIVAANISISTQQTAINQLVIDLKNYGIWNKLIAIYPFVGGTASSHKFNLKDPRDLDVTYRLNFVGGWTHSANGATPNGTNGYANTFLQQSIINSNAHLSYYSRTLAVGTQIEMGCWDGLGFPIFQIRPAVNFSYGNSTTVLNFTTTTDARGFWLGTKRFDNNREIYKNNISESITTTNDANTGRALNIYIGARNNNNTTIEFPSSKECAFSSIGEGLTNTEITNFYTTVQAFQTTLGRQV